MAGGGDPQHKFQLARPKTRRLQRGSGPASTKMGTQSTASPVDDFTQNVYICKPRDHCRAAKDRGWATNMYMYLSTLHVHVLVERGATVLLYL